jgi:formate dehydrogenase major subunit
MFSIDYKDFGTPPAVVPRDPNGANGSSGAATVASVTLEIDGQPITVPDGTSVMRAAALVGVSVPKLCATDTLKAFGSCRLCLVEIEGRKGYPASCTTTVAAGMKIRTQSPKLTQLRRGVIDLYVSDHPLDCEGCPAEGHCELQDMAAAVGVTHSSYAPGAVHRPALKDESNPYFAFNPELCIVCSRCVRACDEVQGTYALTIQGRGFESKVSASQDESFLESECVSCGACVEACPTAALTEKSIIGLGQAERAVTTTCAYCGVGCSFNAELRGEGAEVEVVRMAPDRHGDANHGHACVKGRFAWGYATHADRVVKPMIRKHIHDEWQEVSWEEAISYSASELRRIQAKYGRDSIGGITSSRCTNEETFLVQKLVRAAFGTNNVDTCARVCHSPTGYGLKNTIGE